MRLRDRTHAGELLADALARSHGERIAGRPDDAIVLGLPRGGVPVAAVVAARLRLPLDVVVVRKLGVPGHPELAMGAIGEGGVRVLDDRILAAAGVDDADLERVEADERVELQRRSLRYRGGRPPRQLAGRTALVVDDGVATGSTAAAACRVVRALGATRVVLAVPVAPPQAVSLLLAVADEVICPLTPEPFHAVGAWYVDFTQTTDDDVVRLL